VLATLLGQAVQHADAERGLLVVRRAEEARVEAEATAQVDAIVVRRLNTLPGPSDLPDTVSRGDHSALISDLARNPDTMPSTVWRDPEAVDDWCGQLSPEASVFVYCAYGFEVGCNVASSLRQRGFDARYVRGGLAAWYGAEGPRTAREAGA
jgi:rhodanese-related sulfurtransferase